jgi:hypothetical protein
MAVTAGRLAAGPCDGRCGWRAVRGGAVVRAVIRSGAVVMAGDGGQLPGGE